MKNLELEEEMMEYGLAEGYLEFCSNSCNFEKMKPCPNLILLC